MESISQNEDIHESNINAQDFNNSCTNSLLNFVDEEYSEVQVETNETSQKSTFKNTWQAKKRLQAFSLQKQIVVSPSVKNKVKGIPVNEKTYNELGELQESVIPLKKTPKKSDNPIDKAKAVIEEIELLKKIELLQSTPATIEEKLLSMSCTRRSRSKSSERDFVFRKRERKVRNYRKSDTGRRSPSPVTTRTKKEKQVEKINNNKYPRNWEEFNRDKWTFGKLYPKVSHSANRNIQNDISRHLLFENPADTIRTFYYKDEKGEEILVPYQFLRYTSTKPRVSYNVNFNNIKENFLNREQILSKTNKNYKEILETFLGRNTRTKFRTAEPIGQRNWYQRNWKDNESRVLETSIGLSFLQNYSDGDDDEEEDELHFEPHTIEKVKEIRTDKEQEIGEPTLEKGFLGQHHKSNDIQPSVEDKKFLQMNREDIEFHEHKNNESKKSQKPDKKSSHSTPTSFREEEITTSRTESDGFQDELIEKMDASWTPERVEQISETMWDETPKKKKENLIHEDRKSRRKIDTNFENIEEKQRAREIHSEDEWDETPKRKNEKSILEELEVKKPKKRRNKTKRSESDSSSEERKKSKRKKKKLDRKRKQKEKVKKARKKKQKIRAEKIKLKKEKKRKQKEKEKEMAEKEILKKLKKEIEHNLEEVEREEREKNKIPEKIIKIPVRVKIEKEDDYEKDVRPAEDLRNYLDKKTGKVKDLRETVEEKRLKAKDKESKKTKKKDKKESCIGESMEIIQPIDKEIKKERLFKEDKHKVKKKGGTLYDGENIVEDTVSAEEVFPLEKEIVDLSLLDATADNVEHDVVETEEISKVAQNEIVEEEKSNNKIKSNEEIPCETTPDTDEYHSNWESDDGISPIVKMSAKKEDRSWESDEEIFDSSYLKKNQPVSDLLGESPILEMPLHLKKFSRRRRESKLSSSRQRSRSPQYLDVDSEIKLLEAERINLSKERMQLEIEKIRIHELEREKSMEEVEYIGETVATPNWQPENFRKKQDRRHSRWDLREDHVDSSTSHSRKEKIEVQRSRTSEKGNDNAQSYDVAKSAELPTVNAETTQSLNAVLSVSSSPEITSTESPKPTVLESAYQEFIRAVSTGDDSKDFLVISSADSDLPDAPVNVTAGASQKKGRLTRSERDRNRERSSRNIETSGEEKIRGITDPKVLSDIMLPGEVPVEEIPMPVPSPKVGPMQNLPSTVVMNVIPSVLIPEPSTEMHTSQDSQESSGKYSDHSSSKKPFSFSTLVLPSKKCALLEKSNWKVDEESDEELPPMKKKLEDIKTEHDNFRPNLKETPEQTPKSTEETTRQVAEMAEKIGNLIDKKEETIGKRAERTKDVKVKDNKKDGEDKKKDVEDKKKDVEDKRKDDRSSKRRHSRSRSPTDAPKDKRRRDEDARRKEEDQRRKDEDTRRKDEDARRRDEDTRRRDNEKRRKEEEIKKRDSDNRRKMEDIRKREDESKRRDKEKRPLSPPRHREPSPRRRRNSSPSHRRLSPRHRSPPRRQEPPRRADRSDRRSPPPPRSSPARRKRSHSPSRRGAPVRRRSSGSKEKSPRHHQHARRSKSPGHSPMDGLKRSLADSTISDDLLPQPYFGEASDSPLSSSTQVLPTKKARITISPKRLSLDERINQVLGGESQPTTCWKPEEPPQYHQTQSTIYQGYHHQESLIAVGPSTSSVAPITSKVVQVGNILQVVPTEEIALPPAPQFPSVQKIVQVGNMLQIVPTEMEIILPTLPPPPPPKERPSREVTPIVIPLPEKQSAEAILAAKNAERMAERVKKRREKEERKKEKDKKRKEREKKRKMQLKISTEEVIKRALELDGLIIDGTEDLSALVPEIISDTPGLDPSKSILLNSTSRYLDHVIKTEKGKSVKFADGIRPGEGTSPSGGEELSSPPPQTEDLPKAKKYKKIEAAKKKKKRKIKVKVVKKRLSTPDSDQEFEIMPPPSPPPGSPPPHVFPLRVKVHTINNIPQHYLPSYGITTAPQQQMIGQAPPVINLGYQSSGATVYRPPPPTHVNVIGQHYARAGHAQTVGGLMQSSPQLVHSHVTTAMTHREHQPYGSF